MQDTCNTRVRSEKSKLPRFWMTTLFLVNFLISSWPYEIIYFWLLGQLLCEAQRREHSRSYVTGVVTKHSA